MKPAILKSTIIARLWRAGVRIAEASLFWRQVLPSDKDFPMLDLQTLSDSQLRDLGFDFFDAGRHRFGR